MSRQTKKRSSSRYRQTSRRFNACQPDAGFRTSGSEALIARSRYQNVSSGMLTSPCLRAMTSILGLSAFYHDSAAALIVDGEIVAAAQEERFTRKKHDPGFPAGAISYCLKEAGIKAEDLNYVAFYDKPLTKFDRLLETYL